MLLAWQHGDNKNHDSPYFMDNLNTPDNMSKNTHTKLFKLQFSGASGNKINNARKPWKYRVFGRFCFVSVPHSYHFRVSSYTLQGDYYLPDLALPAEEQVEVGIWGQRHLQYIKVHRKGFYTTLLTKCELNRHLADVNKQAEDMFFRLVKRMAEREGVTEQLKADNQMEWVARMNNIRSRATEIVNHDIIYN